jgi:oxygen-independent coproporphyrinogen-3 oxidase
MLAPAINPVLDIESFAGSQLAGLYVHIPFCFHKCHYCDFYSITRQTPERMSRFVDLLLRQAEQYPPGQPQTVFFGGGTPSLLPLADMERLLLGLAEQIDLTAVTEWTVECNPATLTPDYCVMLRQLGVNRLSFGAQSFDSNELKILERHHDPEDVPRILEMARSAGFERLNIDLIYAIPGQSLVAWMQSLRQALELGLTHLSCYGLTYESNTPIAVRKRLGQFRAVDESVELQMLHETRACLIARGLPPYEISNYAAPGEECRHNLVYWNGENYLGLGPSAASHIDGTRWKTPPHLGEWESAVANDEPAVIDLEVLDPQRRAAELIYLQLRLSRGINFADFTGRSGFDACLLYAEQLSTLQSAGVLMVDPTGFRLTERGVDVADSVAAEFLRTC